MRAAADRRLVKAVAMLRVAAFTCGRRAVNEFDTLLLQHVLWQRPEEAERVRDWLLQRIAKDRGTQQVRAGACGTLVCRLQLRLTCSTGVSPN
jgi:hypothetical protein